MGAMNLETNSSVAMQNTTDVVVEDGRRGLWPLVLWSYLYHGNNSATAPQFAIPIDVRSGLHQETMWLCNTHAQFSGMCRSHKCLVIQNATRLFLPTSSASFILSS
jgi:hypothetical protein